MSNCDECVAQAICEQTEVIREQTMTIKVIAANLSFILGRLGNGSINGFSTFDIDKAVNDMKERYKEEKDKALAKSHGLL